MARFSISKRKPRAAHKTLFLYGEGSSEEAFLNYLKRLYARNSGVAITVDNNNGGAPLDIVNNAKRYICDFDCCAVIIDNDRTPAEIAKARQAAKGIELIQNTPCLEALLLAIVSPQLPLAGKSSVWCKKEFEAKHMSSNKRSDPREYASVSPKSLLDKRRAHIPELNRLISLIDGTAFK